jgi:hypothetical protein
MPKPRVFISSTFYDLKHVRTSLELFVEQFGYDPVLSEKGSIAYDPDLALDESCYREVRSTDIFVLIIGGRYGSEVSAEKSDERPQVSERYESITKREYETAIERDIPTYILVEKTVFAEYDTFKSNRENDTIHYVHVDSVNVFHFLDYILARPRNNPVYQFDRHTDIQTWLREQWAGLFRDLLARRSESRHLASLTEQVAQLSEVSTTLKRYLENVVSKVGAGDKGAERLIETEERRLEAERRKRAALKIPVLEELMSLYKIPEERVIQDYSDATSIDDLTRRIEEASNGEIDPRAPLEYWREHPDIVKDINRARELLNQPPLAFEGTPRHAIGGRRKSK